MDNTKIFNKLNEIKDLLFVTSVIDLYRSGLSQGAIAKMLKVSKLTINMLLKNTKINIDNKES